MILKFGKFLQGKHVATPLSRSSSTEERSPPKSAPSRITPLLGTILTTSFLRRCAGKWKWLRRFAESCPDKNDRDLSRWIWGIVRLNASLKFLSLLGYQMRISSGEDL